MNKNLFKMALVGLAAAFCLSGQAAPIKSDQEVAMAKPATNNGNNGNNGNMQRGYTKGGPCDSDESGKCGKKPPCNVKKGTKCSGPNGCGDERQTKNSADNSEKNSSNMKNKRRSAAQKVVYGE